MPAIVSITPFLTALVMASSGGLCAEQPANHQQHNKLNNQRMLEYCGHLLTPEAQISATPTACDAGSYCGFPAKTIILIMPTTLVPYYWLMRLTFLKLMAYRMRYLTGIATYGIFVGGQFAIWQAIFSNKPTDTIGGLTFPELTTYIAVGYIARSAYFTNTDSEIAARFQSGDVTIDLLRPLSFHGQWLAQAAGETAFRVLFFALPMSLVLVPIFGVSLPSGNGWWQFPVLFVMAFLINAELNILAGSASFWLEDITGLMSLKRNLMMLLSGVLVPLHFLGDTLSAITTVLPFALISYYPTMAYIGKLGVDGHPTAEYALILGLVWCVILRIANVALWRAAARRLEVQGG